MSIPVDGGLDLQLVNKIINLPDPTSAHDAANKEYVDAIAQGVVYKQAVQGVALANVSKTSPGAIGSVTSGQRVLLVGQTTASEDGIWIFNGNTSALTRPTDFLTGAVEEPGTSVFDESQDTLWALITTGNVTVDTTAQNWTSISSAGSISVTAPLTKTGSTIALTTPLAVTFGGTGGSSASAARTALSVPGKFASSIGDGTTTTFSVAHSLGTKDVHVQIYDLATLVWELVQWSVVDVNTVSVGPFGAAPAVAGASAGKRVVVFG
jgi:hypothetical protein